MQYIVLHFCKEYNKHINACSSIGDVQRLNKSEKKMVESNILKKLKTQRNQNEVREFYKTVNNMREEFEPMLDICKNSDGNILNNTDTVKIWVEDFSEPLCENTVDRIIHPEEAESHY